MKFLLFLVVVVYVVVCDGDDEECDTEQLFKCFPKGCFFEYTEVEVVNQTEPDLVWNEEPTCGSCKMDEQCYDNPRYVCNSDGLCEMIPMSTIEINIKWYEILSYVVVFGFITVSIIGGIGGGILLVSTLLIVGQYHIKAISPMSTAAVFGAALSAVVQTLFKKHPKAKHRPMIEWDFISAVQPIALSGTLIGTLFNTIFPSWLTLLVLLCVSCFSFYKVFFKGIKVYRKENLMRKIKKKMMEDEKLKEEEEEKEGEKEEEEEPKEEEEEEGEDKKYDDDNEFIESPEKDDLEMKEITLVEPATTENVDDASEVESTEEKLEEGGEGIDAIVEETEEIESSSSSSSEEEEKEEKEPVDEPISQPKSADSIKILDDMFDTDDSEHHDEFERELKEMKKEVIKKKMKKELKKKIAVSTDATKKEEEEVEKPEDEVYEKERKRNIFMKILCCFLPSTTPKITKITKWEDTTRDDITVVEKKVKTCMYFHDGIALPLHKMVWLLFAWVLVLLVALFKGSKRMKSIVDIETCSAWYWVILGIAFPILFFQSYVYAGWLFIRHLFYRRIGHMYLPCDVKWNVCNTLFIPAVFIISGIVAALVGTGGGLINGPIMISLGFHPEVVVATNLLMIFLTSSSNFAQFLIAKKLRWDYALVLALVGFFASILGRSVGKFIIQKTGRRSFIVFTLAGLIVVAAIGSLGVGIYKIVLAIVNNENMLFNDPC